MGSDWQAGGRLHRRRLLVAGGSRRSTPALAANAAARLPAIDVSPLQGKLLHLLARMVGRAAHPRDRHARRLFDDLAGAGAARGRPARHARGRAAPRRGRARQHRPRRARASGSRCIVGPALETLPDLSAGRSTWSSSTPTSADNPDYLGWALRLSRPGTVIVCDNVVRDGAIADAASTRPRHRRHPAVLRPAGRRAAPDRHRDPDGRLQGLGRLRASRSSATPSPADRFHCPAAGRSAEADRSGGGHAVAGEEGAHRLVGIAGDLGLARAGGAEQRPQEQPRLAQRGELVGGVSGSSILSSPRAPAAAKKSISWARARAGPEAWNAAPSSGKRPASAIQTRNISWAPGENRKFGEADRHAAERRLDRLARILAAHHLALAAALASASPPRRAAACRENSCRASPWRFRRPGRSRRRSRPRSHAP